MTFKAKYREGLKKEQIGLKVNSAAGWLKLM
jgi:hypothetical protein